ncbi:MAG: hypothetical protein ACYDC6_14900 [Acidobacteriaceae bacterium]
MELNASSPAVQQGSYFIHNYAVNPYQNWLMNAGSLMPLTVSLSQQQEYFSITQSETVSSSLREESSRRVGDIRLLQNGWDGYEGYSPSNVVCDHASKMVNVLASKFPLLPSPDISPSSNGTVFLSWESETGEAVIELGDTKFSGFIRKEDAFVPLSGESQLVGQNEMSIISGCLF